MRAGPSPRSWSCRRYFGVHEHIKDICRRLAKLGYLAIATELYARQGDVSKIENIMEIISKVVSKVPDAQVMSDLDATVAWAKQSSKADTAHLGITGFCWGGRIVWLYSAHNPNLKAGVAWYGRLVETSRMRFIPRTRSTWPAHSTPRSWACTAAPIGAFRSHPSTRCGLRSRRPTGPKMRSSSIPTHPTPSSPTTARAITRKRPRTAGNGCWIGSRNTAWRELARPPALGERSCLLHSIPCIFCS